MKLAVLDADVIVLLRKVALDKVTGDAKLEPCALL